MKKSAAETVQNHTPVTIGLLAHVDAGKTTLAEAMLYCAGKLRKIGRVDHQNAFLDTFDLEKKRGITIFSKQARMTLHDLPVTLLDTPGHVDFSPETERTLQILDYAILIISGSDGVQGHVLTLWRLLALHQIPVFVFINKMDQDGCDHDRLMQEVKEHLCDSCIDFSVRDTVFYDALATCSEEALEQYLEKGTVDDALISSMIRARQVIPCFFGSALKLQEIDTFLQALETYLKVPDYPDSFGARVFKIARDEHGERLTYVKITGGNLKVKSMLCGGTAQGCTAAQKAGTDHASAEKSFVWQEKVNQIRIYDGGGYTLSETAKAGTVCALTGLTKSRCGDGMGFESSHTDAQLVPVLTYRLILPEDYDMQQAVLQMRQLEEEEPQLHVRWKKETGEIHVQVMGQVQLEILKSLIKERFGTDAEFSTGSIIYRETITRAAEGAGHFEPLRHYAEVHLLLEPLPRGSGVVIASDCREDELDLNWQRLILTHLAEKQHRGVLTGSPVTDLKITLKSGRAHPKHTEGGDFRQAAYRAVRQGLMQAESILLEPYYTFRLEVPSGMTGRAMSDLQRMNAAYEAPQTRGEMTILTGRAPVAAMQDYPKEVISYTRGTGRIFCSPDGYDICRSADKIIDETGYDPARDTENPADSVFCTHGSGYIVPWYEASSRMHLPSVLKKRTSENANRSPDSSDQCTSGTSAEKSYGASDRELKEIFERTYGNGTFARSYSETAYTAGRMRRKNSSASSACASGGTGHTKGPAAGRPSSSDTASGEQYLLVDGYNIIFAWEELSDLAQESAEAARGRLMDILCNYQGYRGMTLILVFDAYKVEGNPGESFKYHNIHVVYTKEAETADQYIERTVHQIGRKYDVTVATSDRLEQVIILGQGAKRMSAPELHDEIEAMTLQIRRDHLGKLPGSGQHLFDALDEKTARELEALRLGHQKF